jgi:uncharacterized membrane protein
MLPDPLHPAIVHFPVALAFIVPLMIVLAMILLRRGSTISAAWFPVLALATMMFFGTLIAKNTGEEEEDAVEEVVSRSVIHDHEETAELFTILAGILLALSVAAFLPAKWGKMARYGTLAMSIAVSVAAYRTGHSGGELVYEHGAASAYTGALPGSETAAPAREEATRAEEDDDDAQQE